MRTTADGKLEEVKEHLQKAFDAIMVTIDPNTYGSDQYLEKYMKRLEKTAVKISKLKRRLL